MMEYKPLENCNADYTAKQEKLNNDAYAVLQTHTSVRFTECPAGLDHVP